ncbi:MAG: fimbria/pilus periplasmic chaperone [Alphaproteobacteria bacterium]|nr:fimbria/pilus periplasmic chaperone [Alphaproteobacteria bacterium]
MTWRALLIAAALVAAPSVAGAQTGGIQVAPVMVNLSPEHTIDSIRLRNGRSRPVAFEVEAYAWSQVNGQDQLIPTTELIVAPGVFEVAANGDQIVRLGVRGASSGGERAYRILLRELPSQEQSGIALGFTLEMSLPVFITPRGAQANVTTRAENGRLILTNTGTSFAQISLMQDAQQRVPSPRYLLAGASADVEIPADASALQLIATTATGQHSERTIHVGPTDQHASVR